MSTEVVVPNGSEFANSWFSGNFLNSTGMVSFGSSNDPSDSNEEDNSTEATSFIVNNTKTIKVTDSSSSITTISNPLYSTIYAQNGINVSNTKKHAVRIQKKIKGDKKGKNDKKDRVNSVNTVVLFSFLKSRFNIIQQQRLSKKFTRICELLEVAKGTNQIALEDKIKEKFGVLIREQELLVCGFEKYLTKDQLQRFINACDNRKFIKFTPIKNYIRVIPKNVRSKMEIAQKKKMFDGYVVLHTDPENKAVERTAAERKDPILFGILNSSPNYYFIGDWEDEYCDITMDKILEKLDIEQPIISDDIELSIVDQLFSEL